MTDESWAFLLSADGQHWLHQLGQTTIDDHNHLAWAMRLRREIGSDYAQAVLETAILRQKGRTKFSRSDEMYFDRPSLEMSSAELVSRHRARRFASFDTVADLGCGIGGDSLGLIASGKVVYGVEREARRLAMATENMRLYGTEDQFRPIHADLNQLEPFPVSALFFDPARRDAQGKRFFSLSQYQPPLTMLDAWKPFTPHWGIKISPGFDYAELPRDAHLELISVEGELREAVLWHGALRDSAESTATLLPSGATLNNHALVENHEITPPQQYLYEPDPAIIRAQLVQHLATQIGATQIDSTIAYLTGSEDILTPLARRFTIIDWFPFQLKRLRHYLQEHNIGRVTIKKRGSPIDPDQLRGMLRVRGQESRTIFLTQHLSNPIVIIAL